MFAHHSSTLKLTSIKFWKAMVQKLLKIILSFIKKKSLSLNDTLELRKYC